MNRLFALLFFSCLVAVALDTASSALASEFECSAEPCRYTVKADGSKTTAHQVIVVKNSAGETVSFTCASLDGEATTETSAATGLTLTGLAYTECNAAGEPVTVRMNGCSYGLSTTGKLSIECATGKKIEMEITSTGCIATLGTQGPLEGLSYHAATVAEIPEITVSSNVPGLAVSFVGTKAQCLLDPTKTPLTAQYTTGNYFLTGETDPGGVQAEAWLGRPKVLTLNNANGQPVAVNDVVAASLSVGTETEFELAAGPIDCPKSKLEGKVTANPESQPSGLNIATVQIEKFTFENCTFTVGGAAGEVEEIKAVVPMRAESRDNASEFVFKGQGIQHFEIITRLKKPNGVKFTCELEVAALFTKFEAGGKIVINNAMGGVGCEAPGPVWRGIYKPLKDETKGGKTVVMN